MSEFEQISLGDAALFFKNGTTATQVPFKTKQPVTRIETIANGEIDAEKLGYVSEEEDIERYRLEKGDILFSHINSIKHIGKTAQVRSSEKMFNGMNLLQIRPNTQVVFPAFLHELLKSEHVRQNVRQSAKQAVNQASISIGELQEVSLQIPPLPEQKKIAEILSGIDLRIRLGEQKIARLEILLKSLGDKFFGNQSQYETKTIGEIFEVSSGTTPSRSRQDYFCTNGGTPWVKTMDLNDNLIRTTDEQLTRTGILEGRARIFPAGTLLIAMYGGWNQIGRTGILAKDSSCNQAMSALLPTKEVSPEFLNLQLVIRRSYWRGVAASSRKDPNITKADVTSMPIAIPALNEQYEITNALGSVLQQKSSEYQYLETLNVLKSALASDLLSGRKRVSV